MNDRITFIEQARGVLAPRQIPRRVAWLVRRHPRRLTEVGGLVALALLFQFLAGWTGPRTGSVGEAEMIRILEAGAQFGWFLLLPLGLARWVGAGAKSWRQIGGDHNPADTWPADGLEDSWAASGLRLITALAIALVAPAAALVIQGVYGVEGIAPVLFLFAGVGATTCLVGESMLRDAVHRLAADRAGAPTTTAQSATAMVEAEQRGRAARGRFSTRGLPAGVAARAEFFSEVELALHRAQAEGTPFTLLVASLPEPAAATTTSLGESLVHVFGEIGAVGYLGNELWGVGLSGASTAEVSRAASELRQHLHDFNPEDAYDLEPCLGVAISVERETVRGLYAQALQGHQSTLAQVEAALRSIG